MEIGDDLAASCNAFWNIDINKRGLRESDGVPVIMLSDATATWSEEEHAGTFNTFIMFFGDVMTTNEAIPAAYSGYRPQQCVKLLLSSARRPIAEKKIISTQRGFN